MSRTQESQQNPQDFHTEREWQNKFFGMGARCFYCAVPLTLKTASKDHRIPKCRGGNDGIKNIVPACLPCNQRKGWRTEKEFFALRSFAKNQQASGGITLYPENAHVGSTETGDFHRLRQESEGGCPVIFRCQK